MMPRARSWGRVDRLPEIRLTLHFDGPVSDLWAILVWRGWQEDAQSEPSRRFGATPANAEDSLTDPRSVLKSMIVRHSFDARHSDQKLQAEHFGFNAAATGSVNEICPRGHALFRSLSVSRGVEGLLVAFWVALLANSAIAQVSLPFAQSGAPLASLSSSLHYQIDLETLPARPKIIVAATPDSLHADMTIQLEIANCPVFHVFSGCFNDPISSSPTPGPQSLEFDLYACLLESGYPAYVGETCDVNVRALDFGSNGGPASVDLVVRGETVVPTASANHEISTNIPLQTARIFVPKDTTIYQADPTASNGLGESLWTTLGTGSNQINSLIEFDFVERIPAGATITDARIELYVLSHSGAAGFDVRAIGDGLGWLEGTANGSGDESTPTSSASEAASWSHRQWRSSGPSGPWSSPGGDGEIPPLANVTVSQVGLLEISTPALLEYVRAVASDPALNRGILLAPTNGAVRFASDEIGIWDQSPRIIVQYERIPSVLGVVFTPTLSYFSEGQNFRWIYDADQDGILVTPISGRCTFEGGDDFGLSYTYDFLGSPSYQGLDCCTWNIESRQTGVVGTGQAIFYVNVSSSDPAYRPGDLDRDGIRDLCDNCPDVPNGPLLGSCTTGVHAGSTCNSNIECGGGTCSFALEDGDLDGIGDACVPEPHLGMSTLGGCFGLAFAAAARQRRFRRAAG